MKFTLATVFLLAGLAAALPAGKGQDANAQQDAAAAKVSADQKADSSANAAANDGATGIKAADAAEAAILLSDNGDAGASETGKDFQTAVEQIQKSGNQDELATLTGAGINVADAVAGKPQPSAAA